MLHGDDPSPALDRGHLFDQIYQELHSLASKLRVRERIGHPLQPAALLNEAYLTRLIEYVWSGGLPFAEAAGHLGISRRQVHRDWAWARTWLEDPGANGVAS